VNGAVPAVKISRERAAVVAGFSFAGCFGMASSLVVEKLATGRPRRSVGLYSYLQHLCERPWTWTMASSPLCSDSDRKTRHKKKNMGLYSIALAVL